MARGFGSTLGAGTTDVVALAAFTMPSKCSVWVRYLKNGVGGANFGRLFEKTGPSNKEITLSISTTTKMFIERDFSATNGVWEFDDPQANTVGLWADVFFTYDDSSTSNVPLVWVNGRPVTVTTSTTPVGTAVNTSSACYVGNWSAGTRNWDGIISKFAMWNINLGYREAKQLLDGFDPLCIARYAMVDFVDLSIPFVTSQKSHSGLALTGTKIRGDRLALNDNTRFPFAGTVSGAQNLTFSLFTNSNTFYAATVATGAVNLTPALFTNSNTFYAPTVSPGAVDLTPALFTNSNTFYAPTVSATYALTPGLFTNSNTFYAATVAAGPVDLTPSLFSNTNSFYSATVTLDGASQDLAPALFTNSNAFYAATVSPGAVNLDPALFSNTNTFYAPTVSASYTVTAPLFTNSNSFFSPTVQATYALIASIFGNTNTFFSPTVSAGAVDLAPPLLSNSNTFYGPVVALGGQIIVVPLFTNTNAFYAATVEIPTSRLTGLRPTAAARTLRLNLSTGARPAALSGR